MANNDDGDGDKNYYLWQIMMMAMETKVLDFGVSDNYNHVWQIKIRIMPPTYVGIDDDNSDNVKDKDKNDNYDKDDGNGESGSCQASLLASEAALAWLQ